MAMELSEPPTHQDHPGLPVARADALAAARADTIGGEVCRPLVAQGSGRLVPPLRAPEVAVVGLLLSANDLMA